MLGRKTNGPSLFPNIKNDIHRSTSKGIVSAIISASENNTSLGWVGVDDGSDTESKSIPPRPIENDPQVFDILAKDSLHFIHYGKCDTTMTSATTEKLVEKLTREMGNGYLLLILFLLILFFLYTYLDSQFLMDFFLTFRQFLTPIKLCKLLILRFRWALLDNTDERRLVRIRTFVVIRHWLTHYWAYDFMDSRTLRFMLCTFLSQLRTHSVILASPRDELIIKNLRNVLKRQRKFYKNGNTELPWSSKKPSFSSCSNERKDSAIGLQVASSNTSTHDCTKKDTHAWTDKMKRSIQKTVATIKVHHSGCTQHQEKVCLLNPPQHSSFNQIKTIFLNTHWLPSLKSAGAMKPIVMQYRSEIIAQQFCIIEQSMLMDVTWDELIELRWKKRSFSKRRPDINPLDQTEEIEEHTDFRLDQSAGIDTLIGFFNLTCQWIASEIVKMQSIDSRVKLIEKFIRIASKCYHHRNYSSLMQILLGLQSPAVSRLEKTWERVGPSEIQFFKQLKEMAKPFKNWKNVRDCMSKAIEDIAESSAVESILTHSNFEAVENAQGCIPFLGLYLSDLVFLAELPTFIESDMDDSSKEEDEGDKELNERLSNHLVNYNKFRITGKLSFLCFYQQTHTNDIHSFSNKTCTGISGVIKGLSL
ncbi:ras guanine nucleotide exchange factor domain-containing protein [Pilobolus umbonatus]|nr:ras guanine nucleotide exchange factor domain-containing protein [Pilobolus umbonatus]